MPEDLREPQGERRAKNRFPIHMPANLSVWNGYKKLFAGECSVYDISSDAVSLLLPDTFPSFPSLLVLKGETGMDWPVRLDHAVLMALWVWGPVLALRENPKRLVMALQKYEFRTRSKQFARVTSIAT